MEPMELRVVRCTLRQKPGARLLRPVPSSSPHEQVHGRRHGGALSLRHGFAADSAGADHARSCVSNLDSVGVAGAQRAARPGVAEARRGLAVSAGSDDKQEQTAHRRALPQSAIAEVARRPKSRALAAVVPVP
jgi:hypothetical protein